ncbi:MAG: TIGR02147 family protein [Fibrobacteria bacterium]|nr:TIGR02147 family protein [Fibrobacteria bacterium]
MAVSVYNYTDYRKYLTDHFEYRKEKKKGLTIKIISDEIGMKSSGNLSALLLGKYNVSKELAKDIAKYCRLKKKEADYFVTMVLFNQAKRHTIKQKYFDKLVSFRMSCVYKVNTHTYKYYDRWYNAVIRALCEFMDIDNNYADVAKMLVPYIRADEARNSVKLLDELGLIAPDENGFYRPTDKCIDTGIPTTSHTVNSFVAAMTDKAKESLDRFTTKERMLSWNTIGIESARFQEVLEEIRTFRYRLAKIVKNHKADMVYQVNMQAFPVSKPCIQDRRKGEVAEDYSTGC